MSDGMTSLKQIQVPAKGNIFTSDPEKHQNTAQLCLTRTLKLRFMLYINSCMFPQHRQLHSYRLLQTRSRSNLFKHHIWKQPRLTKLIWMHQKTHPLYSSLTKRWLLDSLKQRITIVTKACMTLRIRDRYGFTLANGLYWRKLICNLKELLKIWSGWPYTRYSVFVP